jgi:folate-binding protein YgfZ
MSPDPGTTAVHLARTSRDAALTGLLWEAEADAQGMARPALLWAEGGDAARFLHSQLTSEVERLQPGEGGLTARVSRTGHLEHLASLHRHAPDRFALLAEHDRTPALRDALDAFLFADQVTLTLADDVRWATVQGSLAPAVLEAALGPPRADHPGAADTWEALPEGACAGLSAPWPARAWVARRSLGGDAGFLIAWPAASPTEPLSDALALATGSVGGAVVDARGFSEALEVLRVEAGFARIGPDTSRRRLLPETGWEQAAVSYSKGCYLGQEVIARVRTYGSVPTLLRGLVIEGDADLPPVGADLTLAAASLPGEAPGKVIGSIASRAWSPVRGAPIALAYLDRGHRTPGLTLRLEGPSGPWTAQVALLPFYSAPDAAARAQQRYDEAIRTFAAGDAAGALERLEATLALDPTFADAYEAIGVILGKDGRFHEAIDFFRRLEEVAPDEPMVNTNLSLYFMKLGDKETAEDESGKATLKTMARQRGKGGAAVDQDLEASKRKDASRKRDMFQRVLAIDPDDGIALFGLGNALLTLGEAAAAAGHLRRAAEVDRNNSAVWAAYGRALERTGHAAEAVEVYRQGVEVASRKGDLMPLKEMEHRLLLLGGR